MADHFLHVNGLLWMPGYIPPEATHVLLPVTDQQVRPLEKFFPQVGVGVFHGKLRYMPPTYFTLGVGSRIKIDYEFSAVVDEASREWDEFEHDMSYLLARDEPQLRQLPLILQPLEYKGAWQGCL